jgi:transposase
MESRQSPPAAKDEETGPGGRPTLGDHLPRDEVICDVGHEQCPDCGSALHEVGESVSEMLDWVPAQLRVLRIRRPKYGCRACDTIHQGMATSGLLAQVLVSKYCDHTPLYRQAQIFARNGARIERSTLAGWVGGACWWLEPLQARLAAHVFASSKLFADDTPLPVLDPGRGRTKTGRLWVYARDDRPWAGPDPPAAVFFYSPDRKALRPAAHLENFKGVLQVDGYAGFETLAATSSSLPAGPMPGASSMNSTRRPVHRSPPRPCAGSPNSMPWNGAFVANPPRRGAWQDWRSHGPSSMP